MNAPSFTQLYTVAVRELCEFTAKAGDLDLRFTPAPSAKEGIEGHRVVTARRGDSYRRELPVQAEHAGLRVRGRIDGFDEQLGLIEEIKTHRGALDRIPANHKALHWAQAKVYGALLCDVRGLECLMVSVVYYDVDTGHETPERVEFSAKELRSFFQDQCERFIAWADQELAHRVARDAALTGLQWPYAEFPDGQRQLATSVYNAARAGRCLLAQAPTGSGKTMGTLFPMLKAMPGQALDKVFFLTAKTSGRQQALEAVSALGLAPAALPLRVIELVARDTACEHPDKSCHGESCPLARGFYDRLPAARLIAATQGPLDRSSLRSIATTHQVCPYYLAQEMVRWADVVVGDYNHFFDLNALLHSHCVSAPWKVAVLVDEAHNLVERGRLMYTVALDPFRWAAVRRSPPGVLKRAVARFHRQWNAISNGSRKEFEVRDRVPDGLSASLKQLIASLGEHLSETAEHVDGELLQFYFDALQFDRLCDLLDEHSQFEVIVQRHAHDGRAPKATLRIRNIIPGGHLKDRFAAAHAVVLFSATLSPAEFYRDLLSLPADTAVIDIPSSYRPEQLQVHTVRSVSTRYGDRPLSIQPIATLIGDRYTEAPGNYLAFFSSFAYLEDIANALQDRYPDIPVWRQRPGMSEAEKASFLTRFKPSGQGVGFAVLGGSFGEAVDLRGTRLIGAFIATLGLPPLNSDNESIKDRMQRVFGRGYYYAYLVPGLQKVAQAAGRVIRGPNDEGVVYLIDDRYERTDVRRLFPAWWSLKEGRHCGAQE